MENWWNFKTHNFNDHHDRLRSRTYNTAITSVDLSLEQIMLQSRHVALEQRLLLGKQLWLLLSSHTWSFSPEKHFKVLKVKEEEESKQDALGKKNEFILDQLSIIHWKDQFIKVELPSLSFLPLPPSSFLSSLLPFPWSTPDHKCTSSS